MYAYQGEEEELSMPGDREMTKRDWYLLAVRVLEQAGLSEFILDDIARVVAGDPKDKAAILASLVDQLEASSKTHDPVIVDKESIPGYEIHVACGAMRVIKRGQTEMDDA